MPMKTAKKFLKKKTKTISLKLLTDYIWRNVEDNNLGKYSSSSPYDMPCPKWITNWGLKCK